MMNFERLASRIKSTADNAVTAAKAFKGFDAMAAQDEYIHSADLNVVGHKRKTEEVNSEGSSHSSGIPQTVSSSPPTVRTQGLSPPHVPLSDNDDHDTALKLRGERGLDASKAARLDPRDLSARSPRLQEIQPLLSQHEIDVAGSKVLSLREGNAQEPTTTHPSALLSSSEHSGERRRNANRFMEDLDAHISKPMQLIPLEMSGPRPQQESASSAWGWGTLLKKDNSFQAASAPAPLLARPRREEQKKLDPEENYHKVAASSMLADEDLQQLQAMKASSEELPRWRERLCVVVRQHPRESFVVLTLVLGIWVYFFTQASAEEDMP